MATKRKPVKKRTTRKAPAKKAVSRKRSTTKKRKTSLVPFTIQKDRKPMSTKRGKRKASTSRKRSRYRKSGAKKDMMQNLITGGTAVAGAVAGSFLVNKLPIDAKLKAVLPFAGGAYIASRFAAKNKAVEGLALGLMVMGGLSLVKQFSPNIPMLAGNDENVYLPDYINAPVDTELLGAPVPFDGSDFISPDDI